MVVERLLRFVEKVKVSPPCSNEDCEAAFYLSVALRARYGNSTLPLCQRLGQWFPTYCSSRSPFQHHLNCPLASCQHVGSRLYKPHLPPLPLHLSVARVATQSISKSINRDWSQQATTETTPAPQPSSRVAISNNSNEHSASVYATAPLQGGRRLQTLGLNGHRQHCPV